MPRRKRNSSSKIQKLLSCVNGNSSEFTLDYSEKLKDKSILLQYDDSAFKKDIEVNGVEENALEFTLKPFKKQKCGNSLPESHANGFEKHLKNNCANGSAAELEFHKKLKGRNSTKDVNSLEKHLERNGADENTLDISLGPSKNLMNKESPVTNGVNGFNKYLELNGIETSSKLVQEPLKKHKGRKSSSRKYVNSFGKELENNDANKNTLELMLVSSKDAINKESLITNGVDGLKKDQELNSVGNSSKPTVELSKKHKSGNSLLESCTNGFENQLENNCVNGSAAEFILEPSNKHRSRNSSLRKVVGSFAKELKKNDADKSTLEFTLDPSKNPINNESLMINGVNGFEKDLQLNGVENSSILELEPSKKHKGRRSSLRKGGNSFGKELEKNDANENTLEFTLEPSKNLIEKKSLMINGVNGFEKDLQLNGVENSSKLELEPSKKRKGRNPSSRKGVNSLGKALEKSSTNENLLQSSLEPHNNNVMIKETSVTNGVTGFQKDLEQNGVDENPTDFTFSPYMKYGQKSSLRKSVKGTEKEPKNDGANKIGKVLKKNGVSTIAQEFVYEASEKLKEDDSSTEIEDDFSGKELEKNDVMGNHSDYTLETTKKRRGRPSKNCTMGKGLKTNGVSEIAYQASKKLKEEDSSTEIEEEYSEKQREKYDDENGEFIETTPKPSRKRRGRPSKGCTKGFGKVLKENGVNEIAQKFAYETSKKLMEEGSSTEIEDGCSGKELEKNVTENCPDFTLEPFKHIKRESSTKNRLVDFGKELLSMQEYFTWCDARIASEQQKTDWDNQLQCNGQAVCEDVKCKKVLTTRCGIIYHYERSCIGTKWLCKLCESYIKPAPTSMLHHFMIYHTDTYEKCLDSVDADSGTDSNHQEEVSDFTVDGVMPRRARKSAIKAQERFNEMKEAPNALKEVPESKKRSVKKGLDEDSVKTKQKRSTGTKFEYEKYFTESAVEERTATLQQLRNWDKDLKFEGEIVCKNAECKKVFTTRLGMTYHYEKACLRAQRKSICKLCETEVDPHSKCMMTHLKTAHSYIFEVKKIPTPKKEKKVRRWAKKYKRDCFFVPCRGKRNVPPGVRDIQNEGHLLPLESHFDDWLCELETKRDYYEHVKSRKFLKEYIPFQEPVKVKVCNTKTEETAQKSSWFSLDTFEAYPENIGSNQATFHIGGPACSCSWIPVPEGQKQYLAVVTSSEPKTYHHALSNNNEKSVLQVWDCGDLNKNVVTTQPILRFIIPLNCGKVWHLSCSSVAWQNPSSVTEEDKMLPRLGIIALACGDGCVRIISLPQPDSLPRKLDPLPVFTAEPIALLRHHTTEIPSPSLLKHKLCTALCWQKQDDCHLIACGYSTGMVSIWSVSTISTLLLGSVTGLSPFKENVILPFITFRAHLHSVSSVEFASLGNSRYIVTCSPDKNIRVFDLLEPYVHIMEFRKGGLCHALGMPIVGTGVFLCYVDGISSRTSYQDLGILHNKVNIASHNGCAQGFSVSEHTNFVALGDVNGTVTTSTMICADQEQKKVVNKKCILFSTKFSPVVDSTSDIENSALQHGLVFNDDAALSSVTTTMKEEPQEEKNSHEVNTFVTQDWHPSSITAVSWNPNEGSQYWLFVGNQAGIGRVICVPDLNLY